MKIGLVAPVKPSHPYLENDPAPLLDLHYLRISPWLWFRELYEHLRARISGCHHCETEHDPESHIPTPFPSCSNLGQEITWVCENGPRHYMDVLFGAASVNLEPEGIRTTSAHQETGFLIRVTDPDQPQAKDQATHGPTVHLHGPRQGSPGRSPNGGHTMGRRRRGGRSSASSWKP